MSRQSRFFAPSEVALTRPSDAQADGGPWAYGVPEVIRRLGVTRPTIYRFLESGELRSFRLGSRRLISAEALTSSFEHANPPKQADRTDVTLLNPFAAPSPAARERRQRRLSKKR